MMLATTIARPYAKAAFEYADSINQLDAWQAQLQDLAKIAANIDMQNFVNNPKASPEQITTVIFDLWKDKVTVEQQNFVRLLAENHKLLVLPEIVNLFAQFVANKNREAEVTVTSAFAINDNLQTKLRSALEKRLNLKAKINFQVDKNIIGGAVIKVGDHVIDGSIKSKLQKLKDEMVN